MMYLKTVDVCAATSTVYLKVIIKEPEYYGTYLFIIYSLLILYTICSLHNNIQDHLYY